MVSVSFMFQESAALAPVAPARMRRAVPGRARAAFVVIRIVALLRRSGPEVGPASCCMWGFATVGSDGLVRPRARLSWRGPTTGRHHTLVLELPHRRHHPDPSTADPEAIPF
ncbi:hypothetical protein GCM10022415_10940 [Knoellia locipacati]|uniref:Uncharacterized protein n=1 Tax=Knoellia locipacati TaxID=882824 RepID=A0A512SYR4_9MICO|nr:hypothetical protein KLO01_10920 [Knoellia locipacati]